MIRKITFRAWDRRNKNMIHDVIVSSQMLLFPVIPVTQMSGELLGIDGNEYIQVSRSAYHVMQSSGMTDKKGIEVYEGDIVKVTNVNGFTCSALVIWIDGCFDIVFEEPFLIYEGVKRYYKKRDYLKVWIANHAVEVVGNMYESPQGVIPAFLS